MRFFTARLSTIALIFLVPTAASAIHGALSSHPCAASLKPVEKTAAPSAISTADPSKSKMLEDFPVKNQGDTGCCWISSRLAGAERLAKAKFGEDVPLSENHMILASLFYRVEESLYYGLTIEDGGFPEAADWMAAHIGLVPEKACQWKIDLRAEGVGESILMKLNGEVVEFQRKLVAMKKKRATEDAVWKFTQETRDRMLDELRARVGNFPSEFTFKGKKYTPHSFASEIVGEQKDWIRHEYVRTDADAAKLPKFKERKGSDAELPLSEKNALFSLYPEAWRRLPITLDKLEKTDPPTVDLMRYLLFGRARAGNFLSTATGFDEMYSAIEKAIEKGRGAYLGFEVVDKFFQNETGVISISAFKPTAKELADVEFGGGHAVLITGVYRDANGEVVGLRVQNSWGRKAGNDGYYYMDRDYFETFMGVLLIDEPPTGPSRFAPFPTRAVKPPRPFRPGAEQRPN